MTCLSSVLMIVIDEMVYLAPYYFFMPPFDSYLFILFQVIIPELLSLATIVAYIVCSPFWTSSSAAYESLDSNAEDEGDEVMEKYFKIVVSLKRPGIYCLIHFYKRFDLKMEVDVDLGNISSDE